MHTLVHLLAFLAALWALGCLMAHYGGQEERKRLTAPFIKGQHRTARLGDFERSIKKHKPHPDPQNASKLYSGRIRR